MKNFAKELLLYFIGTALGGFLMWLLMHRFVGENPTLFDAIIACMGTVIIASVFMYVFTKNGSV